MTHTNNRLDEYQALVTAAYHNVAAITKHPVHEQISREFIINEPESVIASILSNLEDLQLGIDELKKREELRKIFQVWGFIRQEIVIIAGLEVLIQFYEWGYKVQVAWVKDKFEPVDLNIGHAGEFYLHCRINDMIHFFSGRTHLEI